MTAMDQMNRNTSTEETTMQSESSSSSPPSLSLPSPPLPPSEANEGQSSLSVVDETVRPDHDQQEPEPIDTRRQQIQESTINNPDHEDSALRSQSSQQQQQQQQQQQPLLTRSTTTPTPSSTIRPSAEHIVESWIQQSLTAPSSDGTNSGFGVGGGRIGRRMEDVFVDAGLPVSSSGPGHRKQRSLGSNWLAGGNSSLSTLAAAPPIAAASFLRSSDHGISTSTSNSKNTNNSSRPHPFYNADFEASWSNHSNSYSGGLMPGGRGGGAETESTMGDPAAGDPPSASLMSDRPLTVARVSSNSPYRDVEGGGISSDIHDAARITNWITVVELCETRPEAAAYIGRDGWTALHHACNRRCPFPNVVEALIRAYPDALLVEEEKGWLPIHLACRFKAPKDVVRLLLHMYPEKGRFGVSRPDRRGRSPLYYAVRYDAPPGVVSLLLEVGPAAVLEEDQNSDSPLALIWDSWAKRTENQQTLQKIIGTTDENVPPTERAGPVQKRLEARPKIMDRWNKVNAFLKAAFGFELDDDWELVDSPHEEEKKDSPSQDEDGSSLGRQWRVLHAVSAIKCHHSLFKLACALHPEQAFELDQNDLIRIDGTYERNSLAKKVPRQGPKNLSALHLACSSPAHGDAGKHVIAQLLAMNPAASQGVDSDGSTPLHSIAENGDKTSWTQDGVEEVHAAHPEAVRIVDFNGKLPLHRAAKAITYSWVGVAEEEIRERSKICRLLQENEEASHDADHTGCLPLHYVAKHGSSWDLQVQALYDANIAAVQTRAGVKCANQLPIHMAAANPEADFSLLSKLVELNPRATGQPDRKGKLPLHLACESGHSWKIIECILNAHHDAIEEPEENQRGWKALHMAAYSQRGDGELISNLTRLHPQAAEMADQKGRYPLHLACLSDKSWDEGLSALFDAYPEAIRTPDKVGLMPLHIMSLRYSPKTDTTCDPPRVIDIRTRNLSRSNAAEPHQQTEEELKLAKQLGNLFNMIKADPTVLDGICS